MRKSLVFIPALMELFLFISGFLGSCDIEGTTSGSNTKDTNDDDENTNPDPLFKTWRHHYRMNGEDTIMNFTFSETGITIALESSDNPKITMNGIGTLEAFDNANRTLIVHWTEASGTLGSITDKWQKYAWTEPTDTNVELTQYQMADSLVEAEAVTGMTQLLLLYTNAEYEVPEICCGFEFTGTEAVILHFERAMDETALANENNYLISINGGTALHLDQALPLSSKHDDEIALDINCYGTIESYDNTEMYFVFKWTLHPDEANIGKYGKITCVSDDGLYLQKL